MGNYKFARFTPCFADIQGVRPEMQAKAKADAEAAVARGLAARGLVPARSGPPPGS